MKIMYSYILWFILFPSSFILSGILAFGYADLLKFEQTLIFIFITQFLMFVEFFIKGEE